MTANRLATVLAACALGIAAGVLTGHYAYGAETPACHKAPEIGDLYAGHEIRTFSIEDRELAQTITKAFVGRYFTTLLDPEQIGSIVFVRIDGYEGANILFFKLDGCFRGRSVGRASEEQIEEILNDAEKALDRENT